MTQSFERHLPIAGTYNIRDLGGYATGSGETRWRQVLRADALHRLDEAGMATLVEAGVRTVIDLRHDHELVSAPNPFSTADGVEYINISLFEHLTPPGMAPGTARPTNVLLELYKMALAQRQEAIRDVFVAIADAPEGMVLFHCTAGKDRTGIIAALLLAAHGVDPETIEEDYAVTARMIAPMVDELVAGAVARGADIGRFKLLLGSEPETMREFLDHLEAAHGGADAYLSAIGIGASQRDRLRTRFVGPTLAAMSPSAEAQ